MRNKRLKELIESCNTCLIDNIAIKLRNVELFGESLIHLSNASSCQSDITIQSHNEIKCLFKPPMLCSLVNELYRILTLKDDREFLELETEKFIFNENEFYVPKLSDSGIQKIKQFICDIHFFNNLKNFNYFNTNSKAIEYLSQFDYSEKSPLSPLHIKRISTFSRILIEFTISTLKFCKHLQTVQSTINLQYNNSLAQKADSLESFLKEQKTEQQEEEQDNTNDKSEIEESIKKFLNKFSDNLRIQQFISPFYFYLQLKINFEEWVINSRPLTIWTLSEKEDDIDKLKDLIPLYQIQTVKNFFDTIYPGFDLLLTLKPNEMKRIQNLDICLQYTSGADQLLPHLDKLDQLRLRTLKLGYVFLLAVVQKEEYISSLSSFIQSQSSSLEELYINYKINYRSMNNKSFLLLEIIVQLKKFSCLKKLEIMSDPILFEQYSIDMIYDSFQSLTNLEILSYGEYIAVEKERRVTEKQIYPGSLKQLKVTISDHLQWIQIFPQISRLKQLQKIQIVIEIESKFISLINLTQLLNNLSFHLKNVNLNTFQLDINNFSRASIDIGAIMKFYKSKRIVALQLKPNLEKLKNVNS